MAEAPLVVGLGNEMRGDDAAGLRVVELLADRDVGVVRCDGEPIDLLELMRDFERIVVVDAVAGERPGRIWRLQAAERRLPAIFADRCSTHLIGLAEVIELARGLELVPERLEVIGIEGNSFGLGARPSAAVEEAIEEVTATLLAELGVTGRPAAGDRPQTAGSGR